MGTKQLSSYRSDEKALEASVLRERERDRKDAEMRQQELENVYKTALRKWEAQEK